MSTTVVMPTQARDATGLTRAMQAAAASAGRGGGEVVVVLSGNETGPAPSFGDVPGVRVLRCATPGAGAARNAGLAGAVHPTVLFTDDDCVVPMSWCEEMEAALAASGAAGVAGPVAVPITGPITAFLDYQEVFAAPPTGAGTVRYPITASAGLRSDRLRAAAEFPERELLGAGGEDMELGYRLADQGLPTVWATGAEPVRHMLADAPAEITGRFLRYGRGSAIVSHRFGRWLEAVPPALDWYCEILDGPGDDRRRFLEIEDPRARACFEVFEAILVATFLAGYLEELGTALGHRLVALDSVNLVRALGEVAAGTARTAPCASWTRAAPGEVAFSHPPADVGSAHEAIAAALRRFAAPVGATVPHRVRAAVERFASEHAELQARAAAQATAAWEDLTAREGSPPRLSRLRQALRSHGLGFKDAMHDIELATTAAAQAA